MRTRNLPRVLDNNRESISDLDIEDRQRDADGISLQLLAAQNHLCGEAMELVPGEHIPGVGCDACDQETRAWNPRFMSMNYALSRLARSGSTS